MILAIEVAEGEFMPVGIANVLLDENGEPDSMFRRKKVEYECGHSYWTLIAPDAAAFTDQLDQFIIWRGSFARVGESLVEWFLHKVHEGITH